MTEVTLKDVVKIYQGSQKALDGIDLEIEKGEFFILVGPSGCGKSTLLKIIAGLEIPTQGEIQKPGSVSMVFQSGALLPWLSVWDNVCFGLKMKGDKDTSKAREYLKLVNMEGFNKKYPRELSGGQRQRVGIARALAVEPEVLLLDEPFSALDPITSDELRFDLLKIWKETGKTIIMISHSFEEAVMLSDRIGVMKDGKLKGILEVKIPRPREEQEKGFLPEVQRIREMLK